MVSSVGCMDLKRGVNGGFARTPLTGFNSIREFDLYPKGIERDGPMDPSFFWHDSRSVKKSRPATCGSVWCPAFPWPHSPSEEYPSMNHSGFPDGGIPIGEALRRICGVAVFVAVLSLTACGRTGATADAGQVHDLSTMLVYVPASVTNKKVPVVFALSPDADARSMLQLWQLAADRRGWIIAASKIFRNGTAYETVFRQVDADLAILKRSYPIDESRVILSGFSGGAMAAHAFLQKYPQAARAVVANTGMLEETFMRDDYPGAHLAVFLASPTDFRYREMDRDRRFLEGKGWRIQWIEFAGGHTLAPADTYAQAADWLEQMMGTESEMRNQ